MRLDHLRLERDLGLFRVPPVEDQHASHASDRVCAQRIGELRPHFGAFERASFEYSHFDQLVVVERLVDRLEHTFGDRLMPDQHEGFQVMSKRLELATLLGGQSFRSFHGCLRTRAAELARWDYAASGAHHSAGLNEIIAGLDAGRATSRGPWAETLPIGDLS